jgi:hypothetical protein
MNRLRSVSWFIHLLAFMAALASTPAQAVAPPFLPIQGYLTDAEGAPVNRAVGMRIRLYDTDAPSAPEDVLYEEQLAQVNVVDGYFSLYLGDVQTLDLALFASHPIIFVGIKVGDDPDELTPLLQLGTAPFAAHAQSCADASSLGGMAPSSFLPSSYVPQWGDLAAKPANFTPAPHAHAWSEISSRPAGLDDGDQDTGITSLTSAGWLSASVNGRTATLTPAIQACPAGSSIRDVAANGATTCQAAGQTSGPVSIKAQIFGDNPIDGAPGQKDIVLATRIITCPSTGTIMGWGRATVTGLGAASERSTAGMQISTTGFSNSSQTMFTSALAGEDQALSNFNAIACNAGQILTVGLYAQVESGGKSARFTRFALTTLFIPATLTP